MEPLEKLKAHLLSSKLKELIISSEIQFGELTIFVNPININKAIKQLKTGKSYTFDQLISISGVDYPARPDRFEVVYHLLSMRQNIRIRVKVPANEDTFVPTITDIFPCANWYEREVWDMFGVKFSHHPDMRRLLTDYGFEGHPLRKDFPLTGNLQVRYNTQNKRVEYEHVNLTQEFRNFDFLSPWEGMPKALPGDEKATKDEGK